MTASGPGRPDAGTEPCRDLELRRAHPAEAGELAALWLRSRAAAAPSIPPTVHGDEEVHRWFEDVLIPSCEVWIVDRQGEAIALMVLNGDWIDQLYVDPASTGRGIGGTLLEHAMSRRPTGLRLWTFEANRGARRFYESHGFVATVSTVGDNEERTPDVCYEWRPGSTLGEGGRPGSPGEESTPSERSPRH